MENPSPLQDISSSLLNGLVHQLLDQPDAEITRWEVDPIRYLNTETSNLGLYRFRGRAQAKSEEVPWSLVLKAVLAPLDEKEQTSWNYHRREILAYQHGLLSDLPGGLQAPRCFGVTERHGNICWLWLEDVQEAVGPSWSLAEFCLAARHLGQFNGAYAAGFPMPSASWLSSSWLRGWVERYMNGCNETLELMSQPGFWDRPVLRSAFPRSIVDDTLRLWHHHDRLFAALERLPRTFCHMDAYRPNLFLRRTVPGELETVAIDWVFAGPGAVGEEAAQLFAGSLFWFEYDAAAAKELDEAIFSNYLSGLGEAGWQGDEKQVRLGYTAACALRWGVIGLWWLLYLTNDEEQAGLEKEWGRSIPEIAEQFARTTYSILEMAEEAYALDRN